MKEVHIDEIREMQMQILDYVDAFCRKHDIKYTISGGTLLGAVRHGGYIPWDDDIDIQMLREEYSRFTLLWNQSKGVHPYELVNIESGNNVGYPYGKVHNPHTVTYVDKFERTGIYIDIFPLDNVLDYNDFSLRHNRIKHLYGIRRYLFAILKRTRNKILLFFYNRLANKISSIACEKNETQSPLVFEMVSGLLCNKPMPRHLFDTYKDIAFENRQYMAVCDTDSYLTHTFGDYMKLPPIEKQVSHHEYIAYWID